MAKKGGWLPGNVYQTAGPSGFNKGIVSYRNVAKAKGLCRENYLLKTENRRSQYLKIFL